MTAFLPGVELSRHFYAEAVRPLLGDLPHAAARLGPGSDVLGLDTPRSTDHDWGPRLELFVDTDIGPLSAMLSARLPKRFRGWSTHFEPPGARVRSMAGTDGPVDHYVTITPFPAWCHAQLGFDPAAGVTTGDWLSTPWQRLAEFTGGAVFHDPDQTLSRVRERLRWYPADLWRYVLAAQWQRIAEEEAFPARAAEAGDEPGARVLTARLCREAARLLLLLSRRWPPYSKWLLASLPAGPAAWQLTSALRARDAREREDVLCTTFEMLAEQQNELGLAAELPATRREFFDRGYGVIGAGRFAEALQAAITDPGLRDRPLIGSIDQISDSVAVLTDPTMCRALSASLHRP
ncbi:DUF4037 domain-containing protein [Paractinoplanes lichenicola]|uniref:DUF4037 domain-containing protein n=1 Tax=Paractinoplanes lichenicola TaxID=2802976 RepID=A0ABS1VTH6_9ACTN|nr:DUF4037 domain-containing protein [Actinoplanes lichenicola]MBL7257771.1 DUF4037 domain-containing protein [Actinoplanes lichenicola]